jgi:hypothetical protein
MKQKRTLMLCLASAILGGFAFGQTGGAITTIKVGIDGGNQHDFHYYGQSGGLAAYSMGTTSCNPGTEVVTWTSGNHPVIGQNFFRLKDGRFEQIGQSWLKHGFCAVNESGCGSCQGTSCNTLGLGCADTYWATLNDGAGGGPKYQVNATSGVHQHPYPSPSGPSAIRGRLQVPVSDIDPSQNSGAEYFAEAQYVSQHTASDGNGGISNAWRKLNVLSVSNIDGGGPTMVDQCAPYAWAAEDSSVNVQDVMYTNEGGSGVHGHYTVGYKVEDLGGSSWRYTYVVYNRTSDSSAGSLAIPVGNNATLSNVYFNDIPYHSGEPFNSNDWVTNQAGGMFTWRTDQTFSQNANANAIRWGNMWSFGFDADVPPMPGTADLAMFKDSHVIQFGVAAPGGDPPAGTMFCPGDGTGIFCPCFNFGNQGHGCENGSFGQGSRLSASGDPSVIGDTVVLNSNFATPGQPGLYFQGDAAVNGGNGVQFGDGLRCAGGNVIRLQIITSDGSGAGSSSVSISGAGGVSAGQTRYYQWWFRDPILTICGSGFNTSNGVQITWNP